MMPGDPRNPPSGRIRTLQLEGSPEPDGFVYVPATARPGGQLFVSVHGIARNALEHALRYSALAEEHGVVLFAPLFSKPRFRGYQWLEAGGSGGRADLHFDRALEEVGRLTRASVEQVNLFGFSGGAQFVHRYAMLRPERVTAAVIAAAGWYTFPDPDREYPRGLAPSARFPHARIDLPRFLAVPFHVIVGEGDTGRDSNLNQEPDLDLQQGRSRLERGRRWVAAMQRAARKHGLRPATRFTALPEVGHSFKRNMRKGKLGQVVFEDLFGESRPRRSRLMA